MPTANTSFKKYLQVLQLSKLLTTLVYATEDAVRQQALTGGPGGCGGDCGGDGP